MTINNFIDSSNQYTKLLENLAKELTQITQLTDANTVTQLTTLKTHITATESLLTTIDNIGYLSIVKKTFPTIGHDLYIQLTQFNQSLTDLNNILSQLINIITDSIYMLYTEGYQINSFTGYNPDLNNLISKSAKIIQTLNNFLSEVS